MVKQIFIFFLCAAVAGTAGCSKLPKRPKGMPELVPCTVSVSFGGEKLPGVGVQLIPKNQSENPWIAGGKTDADGKTVLKTALYYNGAVPGEYLILFEKYDNPKTDKSGNLMPSEPLIPVKYSRQKTAQTVSITKGKLDYEFQLDGLTKK
ncbi:MAG: hypothetical protein LBN39_01395 [Planctomycetaceae bacterium]|jgi:5-hydroxyisourate hydrolase-like protein (transthyretin family)|nr:hypothetical protein [Planctomycetaceae bacterium]